MDILVDHFAATPVDPTHSVTVISNHSVTVTFNPRNCSPMRRTAVLPFSRHPSVLYIGVYHYPAFSMFQILEFIERGLSATPAGRPSMQAMQEMAAAVSHCLSEREGIRAAAALPEPTGTGVSTAPQPAGRGAATPHPVGGTPVGAPDGGVGGGEEVPISTALSLSSGGAGFIH